MAMDKKIYNAKKKIITIKYTFKQHDKIHMAYAWLYYLRAIIKILNQLMKKIIGTSAKSSVY